MEEISEWVPVSVEERKVISFANRQVTIHWSLAGGQTTTWTSSFTPTGKRTGSGMFVLSGGDPEAHSGFIAWTVPQDDMESAHLFVKQSVEETNGRYGQLLIRRQQAKDEQDSIAAQLAAEKSRLQKQLDSFG